MPGIPSALQIAYLAGLIAGVLGWPVASGWFARLWPPEERAEYAGACGYRAAQAARLIAFLVIFLPIVGAPALIASLLLQLWALVTLPARAVRWLVGRAEARAG